MNPKMERHLSFQSIELLRQQVKKHLLIRCD